MKHLLRDNALEAWAMAILYCQDILNGKVTLKYRKNFVSSLHNAVELFMKQLMLDKNDHRVCVIKGKCDANGEPAKKYYNAQDLNGFFYKIKEEDRRKFYSIEYNVLKDCSKELFQEFYSQNVKSRQEVNDALKLLGNLRNNETHFFIDKKEFLTDSEFQQLHNFMNVFYKILKHYYLLPFFGKAGGQYKRLEFCETDLKNFSYKKVIKESKFIKKLKEDLEGKELLTGGGNSAYAIADDIIDSLTDYKEEMFDEVWTYVEAALEYKILKYKDITVEVGEDDMGLIYEKYRKYYINIP